MQKKRHDGSLSGMLADENYTTQLLNWRRKDSPVEARSRLPTEPSKLAWMARTLIQTNG
jgi:hypothetical protein